MQNSLSLIKKILIISGLLATQISKAQNVSAGLFGNEVLLTMSGSMTISDLSTSLNAGNDTLFIKVDIGSGTLSLTGTPTGISVDNSTKIVSIDLTSFSTFSGIELLGSAGNDNITIGPGGIDLSNVNAANDLSFTVELWTGTDVINVDNMIKAKGDGNISINVSKSIVITDDIIAEAGAIYLTSNLQPTATTGNFAGIDISANVFTDSATGGEIYIEGKGGNLSNNNYGVYLHNGSSIMSGGGSATTLIGTGGTSSGDNNHGIFLTDANTAILSAGPVSVNGFGGGNGGSSSDNIGVLLDSTGGTIRSTGTDPAITITIVGYGGNANNENETGIVLANKIMSAGSNIYIEGLGGSNAGSFTSNIGVLMKNQGQISAGGNGSVTLVGTATAVQNFSDGIRMQDSVNITTANGSISITGISHPNSFGLASTTANNIATGNDNVLSIVANKADLGTLSAGQGTIAIFPSAGIDIDLGGPDDVSVLGLSPTELDQITCKRLIIGDTTQTGSLVITDKMDPASVTDSIELYTGATIYFISDTLHLKNRVLQMGCQSVFRNTGKLDASDTNSILVLNNTNSITFPQGLISNNVHQLNIIGGGSLILGDSMTITGNLALNYGKLDLDDKTLTLNGSISAMSASNCLIGNSNAKLKIGGSGTSSMGTLYFEPANAILHTLTLNRTGASGSNAVVDLGSELSIGNTLNLVSGKMAIDSHTLAFTGTTINGGDSNSYIQIRGEGGFKRAGGTAVLFPIGYNPYLPIVLDCSSCGGTDFTAHVAQGVTDAASSPVTVDVIDATWSVTASAAQSADLVFQWPVSAELTMPHSGITLGTRTSPIAAWTRIGAGLPVGGSNPFTVSYTSFSFASGTPTMFGIGGASAPLPMHITKLEADCETLSWQVGNEEPRTSYDILGSRDGNNWILAGHVTGSENSSVMSDYTFKSDSRKENFNFYRLNSKWNGHESISAIAAVTCKTDHTSFSVFPNPVKETLMLSQIEEGSVITIYNNMGNLVYESIANDQKHIIDMSGMAAGLYFLQVDGKAINILKSE